MKTRSRQYLLSVPMGWALLSFSAQAAPCPESLGHLLKSASNSSVSSGDALSPVWRHVDERASQLLPAEPSDGQIRAVLRSEPDFADRIQAAYARELQPLKEALKSDLKDAAKDAKAACGNDATCIEARLLADAKIPEKVKNACPLSPLHLARVNQAAFTQQVRNLAIGLSSIGVAHTTRINSALESDAAMPDFPFDLTATAITLTILRTRIMCKNEYSMRPEDATMTRMQKIKRNFLAYQGVLIYGNFIYIGFVAGEDMMRGEDIFTEEKLKAYGTEFVVSYVWDQAFAGLGVVVLDPAMKRLADLGPFAANRIGRLLPATINGWFVKKGEKNFLFLKVGNLLEIPGVAADYATRFAISTARSRLWLQVRDLLAQGTPDGPTAP
jgi:hypothetical protein